MVIPVPITWSLIMGLGSALGSRARPRPPRVLGVTALLLSLTAWSTADVCAQDAATPEQPLFFWMDNSITVLPYGWEYAVDPEEQSTLTFEHAHELAIGDLFFFIDGTRFHDVSDELGDDAEWTWYGELSGRRSC
jgi:nucleoside-specific outer membrane channel protein Tsx